MKRFWNVFLASCSLLFKNFNMSNNSFNEKSDKSSESLSEDNIFTSQNTHSKSQVLTNTKTISKDVNNNSIRAKSLICANLERRIADNSFKTQLEEAGLISEEFPLKALSATAVTGKSPIQAGISIL